MPSPPMGSIAADASLHKAAREFAELFRQLDLLEVARDERRRGVTAEPDLLLTVDGGPADGGRLLRVEIAFIDEQVFRRAEDASLRESAHRRQPELDVVHVAGLRRSEAQEQLELGVAEAGQAHEVLVE